MSQQINCPECGSLNKIGENFCHNCGTQLTLIEPTEPQPNPTQQPQTVFQDQYPTIKIKPKKPRKTYKGINHRIVILLCSCILFVILFVALLQFAQS